MKQLFTLLALTLSTLALAQSSVPRYPLLEHATNSRCSICKSRNPAMYTTLDQYPGKVHHLAYHPSFPYSNCLLYLENPSENDNRANYYGIPGTPRVVLNGTLVSGGSQLLPVATLEAQLNQTSPVYVQVKETATAVTISVRTLGVKPAGTFVMHAALAEKTLNYNSPNGETVHRDVFRDMLTPIDGQNIQLANTGGVTEWTLTKTIDPDWNSAELYVVAWVQNTQTKEVLNSGTKFDPIVSSTDEPVTNTLQFSPNPTSSQIMTTISEGDAQAVEVFGLDGSLVKADWSVAGQQLTVDVANLTTGLYVMRVRSEKATFTGKFVKQ